MLNFKKKSQGLLVAGLTFSSFAFVAAAPAVAGTLSIGKDLIQSVDQQIAKSDVWAQPKVSHVIQTGFGHESKIKSFGNDIPLSRAIRMVVPSGWTVYAAQGVNGSEVVSWRGDKSWVSFVDQFMTSSGYQAELSWRDRTIQIVKQEATPSAEKADQVAAPDAAVVTPLKTPVADQVKPVVGQAKPVAGEVESEPVTEGRPKFQVKEQAIY